MAEHDHRYQARPPFQRAQGHGSWSPPVRFSIDDFDRVAAIARVAADQTTPQRRLDRRQLLAEFLVERIPPMRVDQQKIKVG
jgi:hypothetical protein